MGDRHDKIIAVFSAALDEERTPEVVASFIRYLELDTDLRRHAHLYFCLDAPEISDFSYNMLYRELQDLEEQFGALADSVTQVVGCPCRRVNG